MRILFKQKCVLIVLLTSLITFDVKSQYNKYVEDKIIDSFISIPGVKMFYERISGFNTMLMMLQKDSIINAKNVSTIFKPDDFDADLKDEMIKLGIIEFSYHWIRCYTINDTTFVPYVFDFKTNWNDKVPWHLNFVPCSTKYSASGYSADYFKRDNGNEGWGIGNGWILWYENYDLHDDSTLPRYNKISNQ